ncbi:MAG: hypothetical protein H0X51_08680 [Parachlamydiaceae bacterium]|nr:hypothetical protein [Parachlamydiaceae bacterium]
MSPIDTCAGNMLWVSHSLNQSNNTMTWVVISRVAAGPLLLIEGVTLLKNTFWDFPTTLLAVMIATPLTRMYDLPIIERWNSKLHPLRELVQIVKLILGILGTLFIGWLKPDWNFRWKKYLDEVLRPCQRIYRSHQEIVGIQRQKTEKKDKAEAKAKADEEHKLGSAGRGIASARETISSALLLEQKEKRIQALEAQVLSLGGTVPGRSASPQQDSKRGRAGSPTQFRPIKTPGDATQALPQLFDQVFGASQVQVRLAENPTRLDAPPV